MVKQLLEQDGVELDLSDFHVRTALSWAAYRGYFEVDNWLFEQEVKFNGSNELYSGPMTQAAAQRNFVMAKVGSSCHSSRTESSLVSPYLTAEMHATQDQQKPLFVEETRSFRCPAEIGRERPRKKQKAAVFNGAEEEWLEWLELL